MQRPAKMLAASILLAMLDGSLLLSAQTPLQVGYSIAIADSGRTPAGSAILSYRNSDGILASRSGIVGSTPIRSGMIFVDELGRQTSIALVNPGPADATATLTLRNAAGEQIAQSAQHLVAGNHLARYVTEIFPDRPDGFQGTLTYNSDQPLCATALFEDRNRFGEPVYATLPTVNPADAFEANFLPYVVAGEGYTTQLVLTNPGSTTVKGQIQFSDQTGNALGFEIRGSVVSQISYEVPPQGTFRADLNSPARLVVGWGQLKPDANTPTPPAVAVFQYLANGRTVTETAARATQSLTLARFFVDNAGARTGLAIANPSSPAIRLIFRLMDTNGVLRSTATRTLAGYSQMSVFANELFPGSAEGFIGAVEVSGDGPFVLETLMLTINERTDPVLTALPVADVTRPLDGPIVFSQIANGGPFSTCLILLNMDTQGVSGNVAFYQSNGTDMTPGRTNFRLGAGAYVPNEIVVYANDFNQPRGTIYPEWSAASYSWTANEAGTIAAGSGTEVVTNIDSFNSAQRFLGELGGPVVLKEPPYDALHFVRIDESICLSLKGLPSHNSLTLEFDLYVLKSWDGNSPVYGPDRWAVGFAGSAPLLATTFSNNFKTDTESSLQDYPSIGSLPQSGSVSANSLGYGFWFGDSIYHMRFVVPHSASSVMFAFSSSMNEGKSEPIHLTRDESWGLDNVRVTANSN